MDDIQSWWEVPSIAHFCSLFRAAFNLLDFDIEELEEALLTDGAEDAGSSLLQELIVRLLCGCLGNNDVSTFNYQMFLRRLFRQKSQEYGCDNPFNTDMDFQFLPLRTKVEILHALCDFRLDAEDVQDLLKNLESDSLRVEPLGHDENHSAYWYFYGTRLYKEDYPKIKKKTKEKRRKNRDDKRRKKYSKSPIDESDTEDKGTGVWQVVCFTEHDWNRVTESFKNSNSRMERSLYHTLAEDFLPEIPRLFAEKERLHRKRLMEYQPRRQSSRLEKLKQQKEEEEKTIQKEEEERLRHQQHDQQRRDRLQQDFMKDGRANRAILRSFSRTNSECGSTGSLVDSLTDNRSNRSGTFIGRQTNNSLASATGQIVIQGLRRKLRSSQIFKQTEEDLQTGMYKILEHIKNHEDAWPFVEPVEEEYAPRYYSIISKPMDLQRMEDKLDEGEYLSFTDFKSDFQLIVDNCRQYNGTDNEYTEMVGNLQEAFQLAVDRYLESDPSSDEEVAVEFRNQQQDQTQSSRHHGRKKKEEETIVRSQSPLFVSSEHSSLMEEKELEPDEEVIAKTEFLPEAPDTEGSSSKDGAELKHPHNLNGTKRKKKTGIIKNAAAIEALELATEQTLKDINKWLDDTPRFSEFSSASNSPSHFISAEEYEVVGSRIESEYRRSLKMERVLRNKDSKETSKRRFTKDPSKQQRRREIQRTIERLQPGKSKGNLIANIQSSNKVSEEGISLGKPKDCRNSLFVKTDEGTPKLSLGTVLASDVLAFGVGHNSHSFDVETKQHEAKMITSSDEGLKPSLEIRVKTPEPQIADINFELSPALKTEKDDIEIKSINKEGRPNLSAWFKAFGAPKSTPIQKKKLELTQEMSSDITSIDECRSDVYAHTTSPLLIETPALRVNLQDIVKPVLEKNITNYQKHAPKPISDAKSSEELETRVLNSVYHFRHVHDEAVCPQQQVVPRQRKVSTGSSMSERSSFSQDLMDPLDASSPRLSSDERLGSYPAPYPSPLHRSPVIASPVMASPKPDEGHKIASYPPLNGTIRVGFYQDTSSSVHKSSPEKSNSSFSPKEQLPSSSFPTYTPRMYPPPHDRGGFLPYQNQIPGSPISTPSSEALYDNLPPYSVNPMMQYYDTSKSLTDQYRAARTQPEEEYSSSVGTSAGISNSLPYPTSHQPNIDIAIQRSTTIQKPPATMFPVKKRLYSEMELDCGPQGTVRFHQSSLPPAPDRVPISLPSERQHFSEKLGTTMVHQNSSGSMEPPDKHQHISRDSLTQPSDSALEDIQHGSGVSSLILPERHQILTIAQTEERLSSVVIDNLLHSSPESSIVQHSDRFCQTSARNPQEVGTLHQTSVLTVETAQMSEKRSLDSTDVISRTVDRIHSKPVSTSNGQQVSSRLHQSKVSSVDMLQSADTVHQTSASKSGISQTTDRLLQSTGSTSHSHSTMRGHQTSITTNASLISERLHQNPISSIRGGEMNFHRGPFSPVPPSTIGMESSLSLRGNLVGNLSHIVDRFPADERLLSSLQSTGSPFFGDKALSSHHLFGQNVPTTLQTPISTTSTAATVFSQTSPAIMTMAYNHDNQMVPSPIAYNRSVQDVSSVLSNKASDIQGTFSRSVPELSSILPTKAMPSINVQPCFNRPVPELSTIIANKVTSPLNVQPAYNRSVTDISSILPSKATPPMDLQTPYNHSVSDLQSMLPSKVPPPISVPSSYNRPITDYSLLSNKVISSTEPHPAPKLSRKRKTKQLMASGEVSVVSSASGSTAFQQYVGLKNSTTVSEPSAIALKTTSVVPGSAFNFGPTPSGLGLYSDKDGYTGFLEDYRTASSGYYMTTPDPGRDKIAQSSHPSTSTPTSPFPFLNHPQPRAPTYPPLAQAFMNHHQPALVDASGAATPLYQQYLQRHQEELLRHSGTPMVLHQGLLAPRTGYPPGYHPALGIRQPYDSLHRPTWL